MSKFFLALSLLGGLSVTSCSYVLNNLPGVYTVDVQQGNIVDQAMVDQLRPNMSKRQVLYIMGSPMLNDIFHQKQWDYLYSSQPGGEARQQKRITLFFEDDKIVSIQGDFRPSSLPIIKPSNETTVDVPKRDIEKTLGEMIAGLFGFEGIDLIDDSTETEKKSHSEPGKSSVPASEVSP